MEKVSIRNFTRRSRARILDYLGGEDPGLEGYLWFNKLLSLKYMGAKGFVDLDFTSLESIRGGLDYLLDKLGQVFSEGARDQELLDLDFGRPQGIIDQLAGLEDQAFEDVEVLGWIYQYYIEEDREAVFKSLKGRKKVEKEEIPAATQLFTPKWIVKYMVENSLGRICLAGREGQGLEEVMEYYVSDQGQDRDYIELEDIRLIDPAMGSGHILVYAFDLLYEFYRLEGYGRREALRNILEKNIAGLDIDDLGQLLSSFALLMKAREREEDILEEDIQLKTLSILETGPIDLEAYRGLYSKEVWQDLAYIVEAFRQGKNYGSIIRLERELDYPGLYREVEDRELLRLVDQARILDSSYHVLVTNPPYMGQRTMNQDLSNYVKANYPRTKSDLFAVFMELDESLLVEGGLMAMINQQSWMFLSSFADYRDFIYRERTILSLLHLGPRLFSTKDVGTIVQSVAFVMARDQLEGYRASYYRLVDYRSSREKEEAFLQARDSYRAGVDKFLSIENSPMSYWISPRMEEIFRDNENIGQLYISKQGMTTSNNKRFLRNWQEVDFRKLGLSMKDSSEARESGKKWFPYNKGGVFRKWYGNNEMVLNYENNGQELVDYTSRLPQGSWVRLKSRQYYFKEAISWPYITSSDNFGARYIEEGFIFDVAGPSLFIEGEDKYYIMGLLTSKPSVEFMKILNPTMNFQVENIRNIPVIMDQARRARIIDLVKENIGLAREDWDIFERSWNFRRHGLLKYGPRLEEALEALVGEINTRFYRVKENEEEINRLFIEIYGLEDELEPGLEDEDITMTKVLEEEPGPGQPNFIDRTYLMESLVSYIIGCSLGRYSLDREGLAYAGGDFDPGAYGSFRPLEENLIIFQDLDTRASIFRLIKEFLGQAFGPGLVQENYDFLDGYLDLENYFRYRSRFYKSHKKYYKSRPIYYMFADEGDSIQGIFYLHRYRPGDLDPIYKDYMGQVMSGLSSQADRKKLEDYGQVLRENREIEVDLDLGFGDNYGRFQKLDFRGRKVNILVR